MAKRKKYRNKSGKVGSIIGGIIISIVVLACCATLTTSIIATKNGISMGDQVNKWFNPNNDTVIENQETIESGE